MASKRVTLQILITLPVNWDAPQTKRYFTDLLNEQYANRNVHVRVLQEDPIKE